MLIITDCQKCVFSTWNNEVQVGCELGRIDKFKKLNLVNRTDNHYVVDTLCNTYRNEKWGNWDDKIARVKEEVRIRPDLFIICKEKTEEEVIENLKQTLSINLNDYKEIQIVTKTTTNNIRNFLDSRGIINYVVSRILLDSEDYRRFISKSKSFFITIIDNGVVLPDDLISEINHRINENMERFNLVTGSNYCVVQTLAYRLIAIDHENPISVITNGKSNEDINQ